MIRRKTAMIRRMPILSGHDQRKQRLQSIHHWNDLVAIRHSQCAAGKEIILDVDEDEGFHRTCMGSLALSQSGGMLSRPALKGTIPPTIAAFVSQSPPTRMVC